MEAALAPAKKKGSTRSAFPKIRRPNPLDPNVIQFNLPYLDSRTHKSPARTSDSALNDVPPQTSKITKPANHKKRAVFHAPGTIIAYDYLKDPSLQYFFSKPQLQEHLVKNGWFAEHATCSLCNTKGCGKMKVCNGCQYFYHISCLPPLPVDNTDLRVFLIHTSKNVLDIKQQIFKTGHFRRIDDVNVNKFVINYEMIKQYDSVLVFNGNNYWLEPEVLGDILAEYAENGGGVVLSCLSQTETLGGKWRRLKYSPILPGKDRTGYQLTIGQVNKPYHPLMEDIRDFNGGNMSFHVAGVVNERATVLARWSNGQPLVTVLDNHPGITRGKIACLNFYPFSSNHVTLQNISEEGENIEVDADYWDASTDGCVLFRNALRFVAQPTYHTEGGLFTCNRCIAVANDTVPDGIEFGTNPDAINKSITIATEDFDKMEPSIYSQAVESPASLSKFKNNKDHDNDIRILKDLFRSKFRADRKLSSARKYMNKKDVAKMKFNREMEEKKIKRAFETKSQQATTTMLEPEASLVANLETTVLSMDKAINAKLMSRKQEPSKTATASPIRSAAASAEPALKKPQEILKSNLSKAFTLSTQSLKAAKSAYHSVAKLVEAHNATEFKQDEAAQTFEPLLLSKSAEKLGSRVLSNGKSFNTEMKSGSRNYNSANALTSLLSKELTGAESTHNIPFSGSASIFPAQKDKLDDIDDKNVVSPAKFIPFIHRSDAHIAVLEAARQIDNPLASDLKPKAPLSSSLHFDLSKSSDSVKKSVGSIFNMAIGNLSYDDGSCDDGQFYYASAK